jgi:hypothetical protein
MNEDALRALVRDTIARLDARSGQTGAPDPSALMHLAPHPSGYKYNITPADDRCVIEPGVQCNHCGYCLSHGH